jgi:hypothetical protein
LKNRENKPEFLYVNRTNVWQDPKFHLDNFDELFKKFEDKYSKLDLFREFILAKYDKQAYRTYGFHVYSNNDGNYSIQLDQV